MAQATVDWLDTKAQAVAFMVALAERYTRGEIELQSLTRARDAMLKEHAPRAPEKVATPSAHLRSAGPPATLEQAVAEARRRSSLPRSGQACRGRP